MLGGCNLLSGAEFYVAIDGKGCWPNLTLMPDGSILAAIYNHPSHGYGSGSNVELWCSQDEGRTWTFRSVISDLLDEPTGIRMNHAVGLTRDARLVALVSGYHSGQKRPFLPVQCCISDDAGATWRRHVLEDDAVPYGDILCLADGRLACSMYRMLSRTPRVNEAFLLFSSDGGETWGAPVPVGASSETHVIRCSDGTWLAAGRSPCRDGMDGVLPHGSGEVLYRSEDDGRTWNSGKPLSPQGQENAHLLELRDGRLLCSFTSRIPGLFGVVMRLSDDGGDSWSLPCVLLSIAARDWHATDIGYPSAVQLQDGTIVTAYYAGPKDPANPNAGMPWHQRYHMGVARWRLEPWPS